MQYNAYEDDETDASRLTAEKCVKINAPGIRECELNLECIIICERDILQSNKVVIASQIDYVTLEEGLLNTNYREKLKKIQC